jgi:hypothetical protein
VNVVFFASEFAAIHHSLSVFCYTSCFIPYKSIYIYLTNAFRCYAIGQKCSVFFFNNFPFAIFNDFFSLNAIKRDLQEWCCSSSIAIFFKYAHEIGNRNDILSKTCTANYVAICIIYATHACL